MKVEKTAKLLVDLRKSRQITQMTLSEELGVSYQAISKWERGENLPDSMMLVELAKYYNITVDEILSGELIPKETSFKPSKRKYWILIIAIMLLIVSPISVFLFGVENYQYYSVIILGCTALSVGMIIYATVSMEDFKSYSMKDKKQKRKEEIIYTSCAGIFLLLGLVWNLFHIAWVIFIFGYVLTLIVKED